MHYVCKFNVFRERFRLRAENDNIHHRTESCTRTTHTPPSLIKFAHRNASINHQFRNLSSTRCGIVTFSNVFNSNIRTTRTRMERRTAIISSAVPRAYVILFVTGMLCTRKKINKMNFGRRADMRWSEYFLIDFCTT